MVQGIREPGINKIISQKNKQTNKKNIVYQNLQYYFAMHHEVIASYENSEKVMNTKVMKFAG